MIPNYKSALIVIFISFVVLTLLSPLAVLADRYEQSDDDSPYKDIFELAGKGAIALGGLSLAWVLMKRKMASKVPLVRKISKWFYKWHAYAAWGAFVLVIAHGIFFVLTEFLEDDTITGILAFAILVAIIIYGLMLTRRRKPKTRKTHLILAFSWVVITFIHAGDTLPIILAVVAGSWLLVWYIERRHLSSV